MRAGVRGTRGERASFPAMGLGPRPPFQTLEPPFPVESGPACGRCLSWAWSSEAGAVTQLLSQGHARQRASWVSCPLCRVRRP